MSEGVVELFYWDAGAVLAQLLCRRSLVGFSEVYARTCPFFFHRFRYAIERAWTGNLTRC